MDNLPPTPLALYRAQFQTIEGEIADVQEKMAYLASLPWYVRLVRRGRIRDLQKRHEDLTQKSESLSRVMRRLIRQHNPNAFQ